MAQILSEPIIQTISDQISSNFTQVTFQSQKSCCRVCYEQMLPEEVFQTCKCKGSNLYIHRNCLLKWIERSKAIKSFMSQHYFQCDICRDCIFLELKKKKRIVTVKQIKQKLCDKIVCNQLWIAVAFHLLLIVIGIVYFACYEKDAEKMAMLCMAGFTVTFVVSMLLVFVYKNLVTEETVSISFEERGKCRQLLVKRMAAIFKDNINADA